MKSYKILSLIVSFLIPLPFIITALTSTYETLPLLPMLIWTLAGLFSLFIGYFCGVRIVKAVGKTVYIARVLMIAAGAFVLTGALTAAFLCEMTSLSFAFLSIALLMCFWLGCKAGLGRELLNYFILGTYCIEAVFLFPMCRAFEEEAKHNIGTAAILMISAAVLVMVLVILNKRQLIRLSTREKKGSAELSDTTQRFNLKLTLCFSAIILFFFVFAGWGGKWLWEGVKAVIRFILSLFLGEPFEVIPCENEDLVTPPFELSQGDGTIVHILIIISVIIGILLLIKPLRQAIQEFFEELAKKLGRSEKNISKNLSYTDFYEVSKVQKQKKNTFKKAYRAFLRENELEKKYRLGYKAFLIRLEELGATPDFSDTVSVHREQSKGKTGTAYDDKVFDVYEVLRYSDGKIEKNDCERLDSMLKEMGRQKPVKPKL